MVAGLAILLLGLIGAGPASASELCATNTCSEVYGSGQVLEAASGNSTFTTNLGTVSCTESLLKGETTAKSSEPLPGQITSISFSGCKVGENTCTLTAIHLPYKFNLKEAGFGDGTMGWTSASGEPGIEAKCSFGFLINCTFTKSEPTFSFVGGSPAYLSTETTGFKVAGSICPKEAKWTSEYVLTKPDPVQDGKDPTVLCESAPNAEGVCPKNTEYMGKNVYGELAAGVASLEDPLKTGKKVSCQKVEFFGEYASNGQGEVVTLKFEGNTEAACESTFPKTLKTKVNPTVTVNFEKLPMKKSSFYYDPVGSAQGRLSFGPDAAASKIVLVVEKAITCEYKKNNMVRSTGPVSNGSGTGATLGVFSTSWIRTLENPVEGACPGQLLQAFTLALRRKAWPEILYIGKSVAP